MSQIPKYKGGGPIDLNSPSLIPKYITDELHTIDMDKYYRLIDHLKSRKGNKGRKISQLVDQLIDEYGNNPEEFLRRVHANNRIMGLINDEDLKLSGNSSGVSSSNFSIRKGFTGHGVKIYQPNLNNDNQFVNFRKDSPPFKNGDDSPSDLNLDLKLDIDNPAPINQNIGNGNTNTSMTALFVNNDKQSVSPTGQSAQTNSQEANIPEVTQSEGVTQPAPSTQLAPSTQSTLAVSALTDTDRNFDVESFNPIIDESEYKKNSFPLTPIVSTISMINRQRANNKMFKNLNKGLKPTIIDTPKEINYSIQGNEGLRSQYHKAAANTRNLLLRPQTSDMNSWLAYSLATNKQANEYALQGDLANEQALQQSREKAFQTKTQYQQQREQVAAQNRKSITDVSNYKTQLRAQRDSVNSNIKDTYLHDLIAQIKDRSEKRHVAKLSYENARLAQFNLNLGEEKVRYTDLIKDLKTKMQNANDADKAVYQADLDQYNKNLEAIENKIKENLEKTRINNYSLNPVW